MFSRKRAHSNPPAKTPPTAAALTAAGQAFLANRASNASLSNAAAAAALRSHTTSPTPVGEIQTRRMIQRRGSASSNGSARPGGLQRRDSGGSMTERTFRDPSPSRNASTGYRIDDAPPVPALPKGYASPPPLPTKSNRRANSVEPLERVLSPPPLPSGRGVSLDRGPGMMPSHLNTRRQARTPQTSRSGESDKGQNRDSVNFSRPMSPASSPPNSPLSDRRVAPIPPASQQQPSSNAANVGKLRDGETENIQYSLQETAQAPVKKKKKNVAKNTEGSYLASGGSGGRAAGTVLQSTPQRQPLSTESTPSPAASQPQALKDEGPAHPLPKKKKRATKSNSENGEPAYGSYASDSDSAVSEASSMADRPRAYTTRAAGLLAKQPSIVREDREAEEQEDLRRLTLGIGQLTENGSAVIGTGTLSSEVMTNGKGSARVDSQTKRGSSHTKAASLDIPNSDRMPFQGGSFGNTQSVRQQSPSTARAAHFSAQLVLDTPDSLKHQPPARSISPAKSALKHSPSRGPSPVAGASVAGNRRRGPASEVSDTPSMISDEGYKSVPNSKKPGRVGFDNEPVIVGRAATPPTDTDSPLIMSPQNKDASTRKWLGLGKDQNQKASSPNRGQSTVIQPTPALPSFGSFRGRDQQEPITGSMQKLPADNTAATDPGASSDQRIGGILSRVFREGSNDHVTQNPVLPAPNEPLPPEVTSVEGSGYHSDTETSTFSDQAQVSGLPDTGAADAIVGEDGDAIRKSHQAEASNGARRPLEVEQSSARAPSIAVQPATPALGVAPSIAIQPATPGLDEIPNSKDQYWFYMPGGFPTFNEDLGNQSLAGSTTPERHQPKSTPASTGIAGPESEAVAAQHRPGTPDVGEVAEGLRIHTGPDASEESDNTDNSIYSDAAEDLSDLEGDGFGSINAIVESPASPPLTLVNRKRSESPSKGTTNTTDLRPNPLSRNESELSEPGSEAGWDKAQAYWSGLSQSRKQQIERAAAQGDIAEEPKEVKLKTKKKVVPKKSTQEPYVPNSDRENREEKSRLPSSQGPVKAKSPAMKSSMRNNQPDGPQETHMRSSMRGSAPAKSSIRAALPPQPNPEPKMALPKKNRPLSANYEKPSAKAVVNGHDRSVSLGTLQKSAMPVPASTPKARSLITQPARRTMSNGSDSSSSFKKTRPKTSDNERYTMKRSMRGSSVDERPLSMSGRASSMTARTSSPADNARRPFSSGPGMRSSMRDSIDSNRPSRAKSPSRFPGFGKSSKPKAAAKGPTSRFSSRFADSSDEDDGPRNRRSRFADSSDEDEPASLTPVRGIPRRTDEGDSTDLEDSSADEKVASNNTKNRVQQSTKLEGAALGTGSLRAIPEADSPTALMGTGLQAKRAAEKDKKKRSFFGGLGSKRTSKFEPHTLPAGGNAPQQDLLSAKQGHSPGVSTPSAPASPQSPKQQRLLSPGSPSVDTEVPAVAPKSPKSPKLQRRISAQQAEKMQMKRGISDSWPLPQSPGGTSTPTMRPTTSDGAPKIKNGAIGASGLSNEVRADRPGLGDRTNTVETTATGGVGTVKKKGWFKKAFGRGKN